MVWLHYKRKQTDRFSVDTINSNRSSLEVSLCYKLFILVRDQWLEHLKQISKTLKLKSFKAIRILIKSQRILTLSIVKKGRFYFTLILVKSSFLFHWMYLCNIKKLEFQSDGMNRWFSIIFKFKKKVYWINLKQFPPYPYLHITNSILNSLKLIPKEKNLIDLRMWFHI